MELVQIRERIVDEPRGQLWAREARSESLSAGWSTVVAMGNPGYGRGELSSSGSPIHPGDSAAMGFGSDRTEFQLSAQRPNADASDSESPLKGAREIADGRVAARGPPAMCGLLRRSWLRSWSASTGPLPAARRAGQDAKGGRGGKDVTARKSRKALGTPTRSLLRLSAPRANRFGTVAS